ncbi:MAG: type II toxin-antitoxin system Phd/YefM family antitoxin [Deltaproteobacteria bacterium]|nr:type II toxin-antitoxin system Phd/YefM family antitoxin [Deltaproteobacteria bacterium]
MRVIPLSEAKMKLSALVSAIDTTGEEVMVTKNGKPSIVLINAEEYENWKETNEILSDKELMTEIKRGLVRLKKRKGKLYTLDNLNELFK